MKRTDFNLNMMLQAVLGHCISKTDYTAGDHTACAIENGKSDVIVYVDSNENGYYSLCWARGDDDKVEVIVYSGGGISFKLVDGHSPITFDLFKWVEEMYNETFA